MKVMKLVDVMTLTLAVFKTIVSMELNNGEVNEWEFTMLQTFHLRVLNKLANITHKMEAKTIADSLKIILEETNNLKKSIRDES